MIVDIEDVNALAEQMMQLRGMDQVRLDKIARYMRGKHAQPYAPKGVNAEYRWIMAKAKRNFLPLVVSVIWRDNHRDGIQHRH